MRAPTPPRAPKVVDIQSVDGGRNVKYDGDACQADKGFLEDLVMQGTVFLGKVSLVAVAAAAAWTLTACGGGDDPAPPRAADLPAVTVSAANAQAARTVASLLVGSSVTLPALTSDNGRVIPAGTKLEFSSVPSGAPSTAIAGFKMTQGSDVLEGYILAGSAIFQITTINGQPVDNTEEQRIVFERFKIDPETTGLTDGRQTFDVVVSFGGQPITVRVAGFVENNPDGSLTLKSPTGDVIVLTPITGGGA